jgi:hypothetical protein
MCSPHRADTPVLKVSVISNFLFPRQINLKVRAKNIQMFHKRIDGSEQRDDKQDTCSS